RLSCQVRAFGPITVDLSEQIDRQENQNKKTRGFKADNQFESKAVQGTLVLEEKLREDETPAIAGAGFEETSTDSPKAQASPPSKNQGGAPQRQGSDRNNQGSQQPRRQNQNKNSNSGSQGQGRSGNRNKRRR